MILRVFGHFLDFESLDLSDFAYYDKQAWYLAGTGDPVAEKNFQAQIWANLGPKIFEKFFEKFFRKIFFS